MRYMDLPYEWSRYWFDNSHSAVIADGFLARDSRNEEVALGFEAFAHFEYLVLLGDPGLGKSTEMERIAKASVGPVLFCNLGRISSADHLFREVFDSPAYRDGIASRAGLTLLLDSLDEGHQTIVALPELLEDEIKKVALGKLRLRISCRSAEWSNLNVFRKALERRGAKQFKEIRLAPLTVQDVRLACDQDGIPFEGFMSSVAEMRVGHFAANPKSLIPLLREFSKHGVLPSSQWDLFERNCRAFCSEVRDGRPATRADRLSPDARLAIAGRIAAAMALSSRTSIWTGVIEDGETADAPVRELAGHFERMPDGTAFPVREPEIAETIGKGLFSGVGPHRVRFQHQIDAEFLAARYLSDDYFSDESLIEILGQDFSYPQLDQISAWITTRRTAVFDHLVKNSPLVLLRSEAITTDDDARFRLAGRLLDLFEAEEASDNWARDHYQVLRNSRLAEQVAPYLTDKSKPWLVRRVAIDIVEANNLTEFQNVLADIALDREESFGTRVNAAYATIRIGDKPTRARLLPLLESPDDDKKELRGVALSGNWPDNISVDEVFAYLDPPLTHFHGAYNMFFYELSESLTEEHLPVALAWLIKQPNSGIDYIGLDRISDRIVTLAWLDARKNSKTFSDLVHLAKRRMQGFGDLLSVPTAFSPAAYEKTYEEIRADDLMRRQLILGILEITAPEQLYLSTRSNVVGLKPHDLSWLISVWEEANDKPFRDKLLTIISGFIGPWETPPESVSLIDAACHIHADFKTRFGPLFEPILLDSEAATDQREHYNKYVRPRTRQEANPAAIISPTPKDEVLRLLQEFRSGKTDAWWQLLRWMTATPDGMSTVSEYASNVTAFPVWTLLDRATREEIVASAEHYIVVGVPNEDEWVGKSIIYRPAIGGYRAFRLLLTLEPERLDRLPSDLWSKWAATIFFHWEPSRDPAEDGHEDRENLIGRAYGMAPEAFENILRGVLTRYAAAPDQYLELSQLDHIWNEKLDRVLLEFLTENTPVHVMRLALDKLFARANEKATEFACRVLPASLRGQSDLAVVALVLELTIRHDRRACWSQLEFLLSEDPEHGKQIVEQGVMRWSHNVPSFLTEGQLADLYIWLTHQYPHEDDPQHSGSYSPGPRDEIVSWRENVLGVLVKRGTEAAAEEVARISAEFPKLKYIKFRHFESLENLRSKVWVPWEPAAIVRRFANESEINVGRRQRLGEKLDRSATRLAIFRFREHAIISSILLVFSVISVLLLEWNDVERWTWAAPIILGIVLPRLYEIVRLRKFSWLPSYEDILKDEKRKLYVKYGLKQE
jgi:hypothetical protein